MSVLRYSSRIDNCAVLGPGRRAVFWVHGCCFSCPGCIGERYRTGAFTETTAQEAAEWYLSLDADGLTISGGEPMLQAAALADMIEFIRARTDCGVIVYTGFVYETLPEQAPAPESVKRFLDCVDLLIDGPYIRELDRNQPYRGSENQRFLPLTDRYRRELTEYYAAAQSRSIEIRLSEERTLLAGVPGPEQVRLWKQIKELGEHHAC